jgi:hypothetical protein
MCSRCWPLLRQYYPAYLIAFPSPKSHPTTGFRFCNLGHRTRSNSFPLGAYVSADKPPPMSPISQKLGILGWLPPTKARFASQFCPSYPADESIELSPFESYRNLSTGTPPGPAARARQHDPVPRSPVDCKTSCNLRNQPPLELFLSNPTCTRILPSRFAKTAKF